MGKLGSEVQFPCLENRGNCLSSSWPSSRPSRMLALAVPYRAVPPQLCRGLPGLRSAVASPDGFPCASPKSLTFPLLYAISFLEVISVWISLIFMCLLSTTLLTRLSALWEQKPALPQTLTHHQSLERYPAHARCSTNTKWKNEWKNEWMYEPMNEHPPRLLWRNNWRTQWKWLAESLFTVVSSCWFFLLSLGTNFSRTTALKHYLSLRFKT